MYAKVVNRERQSVVCASSCLAGACMCVLSDSVVSDSLQFFGLYPTRLLCPWYFSGKNTGGDYYFLLQGIFLTQGLNLCLLKLLFFRQSRCYLSQQGSL